MATRKWLLAAVCFAACGPALAPSVPAPPPTVPDQDREASAPLDAGVVVDAAATPDAATAPTDAAPDVELPTPEAMRAAEQLLRKAEHQRRRADAIGPPRFRGGDVERFKKIVVRRWVKKRHSAVLEAMKTYRRVADLQPPVPEALVTAAARAAKLWQAFDRDITSIPEIKAEDEKEPTWGGPYSTSPRGVRQSIVRGNFAMCVSYARKYRVVSEDSRYCEEMLEVYTRESP